MSSLAHSPRIVVLGAGITGLTAAWHLQRAGFSPVVFDKSPRVGGAIGAVRCDGWLHELGPNSLLEGSATVTALIDEIGLGARRLYAAPDARQRYIVRDGRLVAMPTSPATFLATKLFSWRAKFGLMGEPWRRRGPIDREESVADFVLRRLGREFLDYAINPFVGGVYAGDPTWLSVRHAFPKLHALEQEHGSLIRGALKRRNPSGGPKGRIFSFPNGLSELPNVLANALGDAVRLRTEVKAIRRTEHAWEIECKCGDVSWVEDCAAVVCALPANALASLTFDGVPEAHRLATLREIEHPPVASVFTGYKRSDVVHSLDGFGMLVPQVERRLILGTLFSSTLFPGRAPEGYVGLTSFVGGMREPELAGMNDSELVRIVQTELSRLVGVREPPVFTHVQTWRRAIPQYTLGYQRYKDAIAIVEASTRGLFIGGNCRDGISLTNCIESGRRLAHAVIHQSAPENREPAMEFAAQTLESNAS
jgi:protoporphyrinogen/coproporphyrinogen III oxidase